jgi:hypothetical protein
MSRLREPAVFRFCAIPQARLLGVGGAVFAFYEWML